MKRIGLCAACGFVFVALAASAARDEVWTDGWEFTHDPAQGWRAVEIPHDWAIEGPFDPKASGITGKLPYDFWGQAPGFLGTGPEMCPVPTL